MGFRKIIKEGESTSKFYGLAWSRPDDRTYVCFPVPFNIVFGFVRRVWVFLQVAAKNSLLEQAYWSGFRAGRVALAHGKTAEERMFEMLVDHHNKILMEMSDRISEGVKEHG